MPYDHWGLERPPFSSAPGSEQFYPSAGHEEALARIEYLVDTRRRMGVLVGESGIGKSLTLRVAAQRLERKGVAVVPVNAIGLGTRELVWQLAAGLGAAPRDDADLGRLWRLVTDRVVENRLEQVHSLLLLDDAGQAGPDILAQINRLARLDPSPESRWTIVLAAEATQAARWDESLRDLVDLRIELRPWNDEDTIGFIQTALVDAGRMDPVFDDDALETLHDLAGGSPRRVTRLAEFALLAGAAARMQRLDSAMVHTAFSELRWTTPEPAYCW